MQYNDFRFDLRLNGSQDEQPLEPLTKGFDGDVTANLDSDDQAKVQATITAVETIMLVNLNKIYPVGGKQLTLLVVPPNATGEVHTVKNIRTGLTSSLDLGFHQRYEHPFTDVGIHFYRGFDPTTTLEARAGVIRRDNREGMRDLGVQPRWDTSYGWYGITWQEPNYSLFTLDYTTNGNQSAVRARAEFTDRKHTYVDWLMRGYSFRINLSPQRQYSIGFLYQLLIGPKLGYVVRNYHINQKVESRRIYQLSQTGKKNGNGSTAPAPPPNDVPFFQLPSKGRGKITLDSSNIGKLVRVYRSNVRYGRGRTWDGTEQMKNELEAIAANGPSYKFEII